MNTKTLLTFLSLFLLLQGKEASAQRSYYVDSAAAVNGTGTIASPWNNLITAMNNVGTTSGDTTDVIIYFRKGTYFMNGNDTVIYVTGSIHSGQNGHYFTLAAYPGERPVFDGSKITANYKALATINDANYVRFKGLTFANLENVTGYGLYVEGTSTNIDIRDCTFKDLLWDSDTAEAKFPSSSDNNIYPVYVTGSAGVPSVLIDTSNFTTIAPGYYGSLVYNSGATVTQTDDIDSNIIYAGPRYQFYVSPTGSDTTGTGSKAKPWKTINNAVNTAGYNFSTVPPVLLDSNITIFLRNGTYYLTAGVYIGPPRAQNGKWFTITHYPGETATVDGGGLTAKYSCIFIIDSASYVNINGLNIQNLTDDSTLTTVVDGVTYKDVRYGIIIEGPGSNIQILNNDMYNMQWTKDTTKARNPTPSDVLSAITVLGNTNTPITNLVIDSNTVHSIVSGYAEGVTINGNVDTFQLINNEIYDIANIGMVAAGNYAWVLASYPSLLKANNQSRNGLIKDNTVYRCISPIATSAGIYLDGSLNVTVTGNESYNNGTGISVGNEQDSSTSGGHTIISNNVWNNLGPGMYLGSNNPTSTCSNVVVKYNTISNDYTINPTLYNRAVGRYGTLDSAGQWVEVVTDRIQNLTFDENEVYSSSDNVLAFAFSQSGLKFTYNEYYTKHNNPCASYFYRDTVGNGYTNKIDSTFNKYGFETKLDTTSYLGGVAYNNHGCGIPAMVAKSLANGLAATFNDDNSNSISVFPDPVVNRLSIYVTQQTGGQGRIELWDMSGKLMLKQEMQLSVGINQLGWDDIKQAGVVPGVYVLHIVAPGQNATRKILVL